MSLTLLEEEFPQFVCLEHPESCKSYILIQLSFKENWKYFAIFSNKAVWMLLAR